MLLKREAKSMINQSMRLNSKRKWMILVKAKKKESLNPIGFITLK
jgi:hypothetical protein